MSQEVSASAEERERPKFVAPKKRKKWPRRLILLAVAAAALTLVYFLFGRKDKAASSDYIPATVELRDMAVTVTGTGTVAPNDVYRAAALLRGDILDAPFEEGDTVVPDQLLFQLDPEEGETAVRSARSAVERAELALEQAQMNVDTLQKTRRDNVDDMAIKSKATGKVALLHVKEGDMIAAGTPIATILDRDTMSLTVPFHAVDAAAFSAGQAATVTVAGTNQVLSGAIREIGTVDTVLAGGARVRSVVIDVPNPGALSQGTAATALVGDRASAAAGTFDYKEQSQLLALMSGELERLDIKEGDWVTEDQVVGSFALPDLDDQIRAAQLNVRSAQLGLEDAQDALRRTEDALEDFAITCPIRGTVIEKNAEAGDTLDGTMTTPLAVIYDLSRLTFDMSISELDVAQLRVGQPVTFTSSALEGRSFTGRVEKINLNGVTMNGATSYPVTVEILEGDGLYPGMNVSATVLVEDVGSVLSVPVDAIQRGNLVLVAGEGALNSRGELVDPEKLEERQVTLGRSDSESIEILSGLDRGDTVYIPNIATNVMDMMMSMGGVR